MAGGKRCKRKRKDLHILVKKLMSMLRASADGILSLETIAKSMHPRESNSIIDIISVLQGVGLIKKFGTCIQWNGTVPERDAEEVTNRIMALKGELDVLDKKEEEIDLHYSLLQQSFSNTTNELLNNRLAYISHEDICKSFLGETLFLIHTPSTLQLAVPGKVNDSSNQFLLHLKSSLDPINILLLNKENVLSPPVMIKIPPQELVTKQYHEDNKSEEMPDKSDISYPAFFKSKSSTSVVRIYSRQAQLQLCNNSLVKCNLEVKETNSHKLVCKETNNQTSPRLQIMNSKDSPENNKISTVSDVDNWSTLSNVEKLRKCRVVTRRINITPDIDQSNENNNKTNTRENSVDVCKKSSDYVTPETNHLYRQTEQSSLPHPDKNSSHILQRSPRTHTSDDKLRVESETCLSNCKDYSRNSIIRRRFSRQSPNSVLLPSWRRYPPPSQMCLRNKDKNNTLRTRKCLFNCKQYDNSGEVKRNCFSKPTRNCSILSRLGENHPSTSRVNRQKSKTIERQERRQSQFLRTKAKLNNDYSKLLCDPKLNYKCKVICKKLEDNNN
ncbi:uncharacterized protein [Centruroides vittatus]|uniref:uncharacterized protein n=1 Tax=Centruroides vittatus TaxID=120091 RepID=UPI00350F7B77